MPNSHHGRGSDKTVENEFVSTAVLSRRQLPAQKPVDTVDTRHDSRHEKLAIPAFMCYVESWTLQVMNVYL